MGSLLKKRITGVIGTWQDIVYNITKKSVRGEKSGETEKRKRELESKKRMSDRDTKRDTNTDRYGENFSS